MSAPCLAGKYVRLAVMDQDGDLEKWSGWFRNTEYQRLLDTGPSMLWTAKQIKEWLEKENKGFSLFGIHTLATDELIGFIDLSGFNWVMGSAWTAIGVGDQNYWGRGYGSDAMQVLLRYAFCALNLKRVNLTVFEYNERAYRSYLKCGFKEEGRARQLLNRFDRRWDMIYMGILREEWRNPSANS